MTVPATDIAEAINLRTLSSISSFETLTSETVCDKRYDAFHKIKSARHRAEDPDLAGSLELGRMRVAECTE